MRYDSETREGVFHQARVCLNGDITIIKSVYQLNMSFPFPNLKSTVIQTSSSFCLSWITVDFLAFRSALWFVVVTCKVLVREFYNYSREDKQCD